MKLLQRLLSNRQEVLLLYKNSVFCSCGEEFDDYTDAENHVVKHVGDDKISGSSGTAQGSKNFIFETLKDLSKKLAQTVFLPEKVCAITLEESDIGNGQLQDMDCPKCHQELRGGFLALKDHYLSCHASLWRPFDSERSKRFLRKMPIKADYSPGWTFRFYCPIPDCKYHLLTNDAKYFKNRVDIKQHYAKVHASKTFSCPNCKLKFSTEAYLNRHQTEACGKSFRCNYCTKSYTAVENLKTHCRRKNHPFPLEISKTAMKTTPKHVIPLIDVSHLMTTVLPQQIVSSALSAENHIQDVKYKNQALKKIAPKPSPLHMSAAVALSELAGNPSQTLLMPSNHSSSLISQPNECEVRCSTQVQTSITGCFVNVCEQETQTTLISGQVLNLTPFSSSNDFLIAEKFNWSSSTQTSPRIVSLFDSQDLMKANTRDFSTNIDENDFMLLNDANFNNQGLVSKRRAPHLGEIEQFSTETQTETDFEMLKKPRLTNSPASDVDDDPLFGAIGRNQMEAETQFDLGDILCSNYTQTGDNYDFSSFLHPMDDDSCPSPVTFNSSKTQTIDSSFVSSTLDQITQSNSSLQPSCNHGDSIHMETQTTVDDVLSFPQF